MTRSRYLENERVHISANRVLGVDAIHKFGAVPAMSQGETGTIWDVDDTSYPWTAWETPGVLTIPAVNVSDNGDDVIIRGLDQNFNAQSERLTVSSTGTVTGTKTFSRVFRAYFYTNTNTTNVGVINIQRSGTTVARIQATKGQTLMAVYTIPKGKVGFIMQTNSTCQSNADATLDMFVRYYGQANFRIQHTAEISGTGGGYMYDFIAPIRVEERSDIDMRATVRSNNARVTSAFDIILLDKTLAGRSDGPTT